MSIRRLLIVIDMQHDFIDGSLGTPEAVAIVPRVVEEIKKYSVFDLLATRDTHPADYLSTQEGKRLPVVHCVKGSPGWELHPLVAEALGAAPVIDKPTFGSTTLAEIIRSMAETNDLDITLVGLCTDICVISNALLIKAFVPEVPIHVLSDCCAGVTPATHEAALTTMKMCQIDVL